MKGNLHCHTTMSDGRKTPEEVAGIYRSLGYDFLAITDHRVVTEPKARTEDGMLLLPGVELDYTLSSEVVHIVGFGMTEDVMARVNFREGPQNGIDSVRACGGRAIVCHPAWSLNTTSTLSGLVHASAAEVYNSVSDIPWNGQRADSSNILDIAAAHGALYGLMANDDSHYYQGEQGQGFTMVQAESNTPEAILKAIDEGLFYASRGPRFEQISIEDGRMIVRCSPVSHIVFYSNLVWTSDRCLSGSGLTQGECELRDNQGARFLRCQLIDAEGRSAWSSPIVL